MSPIQSDVAKTWNTNTRKTTQMKKLLATAAILATIASAHAGDFHHDDARDVKYQLRNATIL
jgi:hypothetical protein